MMYAKIFTSLFDGSMRGQPDLILVFVNMLCHADEDGVVDRHWRAIADETGLPVERVMKAIVQLEGPDPESRTPTDHGKRIVRIDEHREWGWMIVNYKHYRDMATREQSKAKTRERVRKYREKQRCNDDVTLGNDSSSASTCTSTSVSTSASTKQKVSFAKPTAAEVTAYGQTIDYSIDGEAFVAFYESNGWKVGRNAMKNWKSAVVTWKKRDGKTISGSNQPGNGSPKPTTRFQLSKQLESLESLWEQHKSNDSYRSQEAQDVKDKMKEVKKQLAFFE
jgi:hypothetical protein